jgi:Protein kinase domain/SPOR domain
MPSVDETTVKIVTREAAGDGSPTRPSAPPDPYAALFLSPSIPNRYEILSEIGRGGMGIVYQVRDIDTLEILALKILKPEVAGDPAMRESLRQEVCLARKVTHKNVCRLHEFNRFESTACISMEFVDGVSLLSRLRSKGALPPSEAVEIARQVCAGLSEAHAQGIVHRDLKPANIMISGNQIVKIMDFGIARKAHETGQTENGLAGTPAYMAPEQVESKPLSARTDIYALGLLLYEMATGRPAFTGDSAVSVALQQLHQSPTRPSKIVSSIPQRLEAAILKCIEKDPKKRFASVADLSAALDGSLLPAPVQAISETMILPAKLAVASGVNAAASRMDLLAERIARWAARANGAMPPKIREWTETVCGQRWLSRPVRTAQVALVFGATLLSTSLVFAFLTRAQTHPNKGLTNLATVYSLLPGAQNPPLLGPGGAFGSKEFEFDSTPDAGHDATTMQDDTVAASGPTPSLAKKPSAAKQPTSKKLAAPGAPTQTQPSAPSTFSVSNPDSAFSEALRTSPLPVDTASFSPNELSVLTPAPPSQIVPESALLKPGTSETYLEVGVFNDAAWADDAVSKLSNLGFRAICVHKSHLWAQSYHVEVGPFTTLLEMEDTSQRLAAKGFKPHAVK